MRLYGKTILMIVGNGVDQGEFGQLKEGLESEQAMVLVTSPDHYLTVESVHNGKRGQDIIIDIPFESLDQFYFDGLIIPSGLLSSETLAKDVRVLEIIAGFHKKRLPIFASGDAVKLLYDCQVLFDRVVVREGTPLDIFLDKAVEVLTDSLAFNQKYRPSMS